MYYAEPIPHVYQENSLPEDVYQRLLDYLPDTSEYEQSEWSPNRYMLNLGEPKHWDLLRADMTEHVFPVLVTLLNHFDLGSVHTYNTYFFLVRDFAGYNIKPHTDIPERVLSVFYYLPPDDSLAQYGTTLCKVTNPDFVLKRKDGYVDEEDFGNLVMAKTMEFKRNSMFAFPRSDTSFHCVPVIEDRSVVRNSLLIMIGKPGDGYK